MAEEKDKPKAILLTRKDLLIALHNENLNQLIRQEVDLEMNEILSILDTDSKVEEERAKVIKQLKEGVENYGKVLKIVQRKLIEAETKPEKESANSYGKS